MDVNDYLENAINGGPSIKPDEKRKYLGNFRERCYLDIQYHQLNLPYLWDAVTQVLSNHEATLFINNQLPFELQNKFIKLCKTYHRSFTLVTQKEPITSDTIVVVYADNKAVHIENSNIESYKDKKVEIPHKEKKSFLKRFFK